MKKSFDDMFVYKVATSSTDIDRSLKGLEKDENNIYTIMLYNDKDVYRVTIERIK